MAKLIRNIITGFMQDKQPNFGPLMGIRSVSRSACVNQNGVGPYIQSSKCVRPTWFSQ